MRKSEEVTTFWPDGARLAVSFSLMFEGGGQPISGAGGVIPERIEGGVPDLPTNAFFAYGHDEGIWVSSTTSTIRAGTSPSSFRCAGATS